MKIAFLNTDYEEFLLWLYRSQPGLSEAPYADQLRARNSSLFSVADFYSHAFRSLGHEAYDFHVNNPWLQAAWAREQGLQPGRVSVRAATARAYLRERLPRRIVKAIRRSRPSLDAPEDEILRGQLAAVTPDIVVNQAVGHVPGSLLRHYAPGSALVGHVASTVRPETLTEYDLIASSLPTIVEAAERRGVPAALSRFGFDARVLDLIGPLERDIPISFVGSLTAAHPRRIALLERLCSKFDVHVYGSRRDVDSLPRSSTIRRSYRSPAWGVDMYRILRRSRITLNDHGDVWVDGENATNQHANNIRLFEATGCGSLLLTDLKPDLPEIFVPGEEVVAYRSPDDCSELLEALLEDDDRVTSIAARGQRRTLADHTYGRRARELEPVLMKAAETRRSSRIV